MLNDWNRLEQPSKEEMEQRLKKARARLEQQQILMKEKKLPVLVLLEGRHAYKAISQYGFSSWLDTQLDSPVYMVLTILIVAGLLAGGIAGMISVRREGKKIEELKRRRMIEE